VKLAQRGVNDVAGQSRGRKDAKQSGRQHECEKDNAADPDDQGQQHEKLQEPHVGKSIAVLLKSRT
jgi:hypothetical protein